MIKTTKAPTTTKTSKPQLSQSKSGKKYGNIKSSGYGRSSYHPKPLHGRLSHPASKDPANISAGTHKRLHHHLYHQMKSHRVHCIGTNLLHLHQRLQGGRMIEGLIVMNRVESHFLLVSGPPEEIFDYEIQ